MAKLKIKKKKNFVSFFGENAYKILFVPREGLERCYADFVVFCLFLLKMRTFAAVSAVVSVGNPQNDT